MRWPSSKWCALLLMIAGCSVEVPHAPLPIAIGETLVLDDNDVNARNFVIVNRVTLSQSATLESLSIHLKSPGSPAGNIIMGVYDDDGTEPNSLRASTASVPAVAGWNTVPVTTPVLLSSGTYWLAVIFYLDSTTPSRTASSGVRRWVAATYGPLPTTFPSGSFSGTGHYSFYATLLP